MLCSSQRSQQTQEATAQIDALTWVHVHIEEILESQIRCRVTGTWIYDAVRTEEVG